MTAPLGMSFDFIIEIVCTQTNTVLYKYLNKEKRKRKEKI